CVHRPLDRSAERFKRWSGKTFPLSLSILLHFMHKSDENPEIMDSKRNWILLEASTSSSATPIHILGSRRRITPVMEQYSDQARLQTINRLNDRIHKRIMNNYRNSTDPVAGEGAAVIDESFRFIDDEQSKSRVTRPEPIAEESEHVDPYISHRNSSGEIEAVYERRLPSTSSREDILRPQSILNRSRPYEEPIYVKPAIRSARMAPTSASPRNKLQQREYRSGKYYRTNSAVEYTRYGREEVQHQPSRSNSLDSGSLRIQRYVRLPRWRPPLRTYTHYDKIRGNIDRQRYGMADEPRPSFLHRSPQFYDKCDLCVFQVFRPGYHCPACGRGETLRSWAVPPAETSIHIPSQILNVRTLNMQRHDDSPQELPSKYFSTEFRELYPISRRLSRRQTKSPVYRYGLAMPPALYDYDVWACRQDRRSLITHAAILALVLFSVAFVISAGVILVVTVA
uniref:Palmitoyltransferase n=1 Tax=Haemonchus contortus TaxID=6289 RepID=A0A7I5EE01_HAECO